MHSGTPDLRGATTTLTTTLYDLMGQSLLEKASAEPSLNHRQIQLLHNLIDQ